MAGLPNITGGVKNQALFDLASGYGAIKTTSGGLFGGGNNNYTSQLFSLDASRSSTIYGNSDTVTPLSMSCLICISY